MAEIGCGYGSEFQLMRFLGHHRHDLNRMIKDATGESGDIQWLDFPYDDNRISGDGEWKGVECFNSQEVNYSRIENEWKKFWPQTGTAMNWDGIFRIGDTWFFVEAKAHRGECFQECSASSEDSKSAIIGAFEKTQGWLGATKNDWINTKCYQLANRLAFIYFCNHILGMLNLFFGWCKYLVTPRKLYRVYNETSCKSHSNRGIFFFQKSLFIFQVQIRSIDW